MRFPRLVSWNTYCQATRALPAEQRNVAHLRQSISRPLARYLVERRRHREKVADCESLKRLLPADVLAAWKAGRK
jgi:hypothetical protein